MVRLIWIPPRIWLEFEVSDGRGRRSESRLHPDKVHEVVSARESLSSDDEDITEDIGYMSEFSCTGERDARSSRRITNATISTLNSGSSDSKSSYESEVYSTPDVNYPTSSTNPRTEEDFRIIPLDVVRSNSEWTPYSPSQAVISKDRACRAPEAGISDLLSPILSVIPDDHEAFWCFVGFMKKARHNFRLDEVGIRRQLNIVSKIIKSKDSQLYRHLEKLQAEDCFFVHRMVVVMFRRELTLVQTFCLWEVIWADQAAIRAGMGKSAWSRIRQCAPPIYDLVFYAIAASVLQRRTLIIEMYNSMDKILRECHSMAVQLDVWKLLDDAHDLVVTLHTKIEHSFS
ncbi:unnamed protein product [Thlaspi arvense]|uniref:Rab-GAP TBC domain-containing protein n=1 Tax=Thlaspi arvense TaxID=13288 RepID=A0AAU9SGJ8_THLAR|nr:unnamed protein product [Thlaspi arvense]